MKATAAATGFGSRSRSSLDAVCGRLRRPHLDGLRPFSAAGGGGERCFPPSVFPLWKPPFLIPPFSKESTKGGKPRGAPARRPLWRGARRGSLYPTPLVCATRRRPTGCRRHSAAQPPLRLPPPGAGRVGQAATGSARSGLRHGVGLPWNGGGQAVLPAASVRRNPGFTARRTRLRPRVVAAEDVGTVTPPRRRAPLRQASRRQSRHVACWSLRPEGRRRSRFPFNRRKWWGG